MADIWNKDWSSLTFDEKCVRLEVIRDRDSDPDVKSMRKFYDQQRKRSRLRVIRDIIKRKKRETKQ